MSERDESSGGGVGDYLRVTGVGRHESVSGKELDPSLRLLREWQSARLARTHADLLADERYGPACRFFLTDVYAARDFSQRDHDITRMHDALKGVLPPAMGRALELVVDLNALTVALDTTLLRVLVDEVGMTDSLDAAQYAEGYRRSDNRADRERQLDLIVALGREIDGLVRKPAVGLALRLAAIPARLAGWHELQNFFERGFAAFKKMNGAEPFLETVSSRERLILDRIYAGSPNPFEI